MVKFLFKSPSCPSRVSFRFLLLKQQRSKARRLSRIGFAFKKKGSRVLKRMQGEKKGNNIEQNWLTEVWGGIGEQKQSGNESQWRRIHFLVPASVGPGPLLSRLSLTRRMMAHVCTHTNHTRALTFDLEFERNTVKPRRSSRQFSRRRGRGGGKGFLALFFFPPSLFLPLARASSCRGQKIFVKRQTWSRTKDLRYPSCSSRIIYFSL